MRYLYEGCHWPFPHRITGDGYDRLMHGPLGSVVRQQGISPSVWVPGLRADSELRARLRAEGRLLSPVGQLAAKRSKEIGRIIAENYGKVSDVELTKMAGCSRAGVYDWSIRLGLRSRELSPEIQALVRENLGHMGLRQMAHELGISERAILHYARCLRKEVARVHV